MTTELTLSTATVVSLTGSLPVTKELVNDRPYSLVWNNNGTPVIIGKLMIPSLRSSNFHIPVTLPGGNTYTLGSTDPNGIYIIDHAGTTQTALDAGLSSWKATPVTGPTTRSP